MKLKISDRLAQPQISHYIEWLGRVGYRNVNCTMTYTDRSYELMDELFGMLKKLKPVSKNGARQLWVCAKRGSIEDFAKSYGDVEDLIEEGLVKDAAQYEEYWKESFPNEYEWYEMTAVEDPDITYQAVFLQHKHVLEQDGREERFSFTHDIEEFIEWLIDSVRFCIEALEAETYNDTLEQELPDKHRTGTILRKDLWEVYPEGREEYFEDISQDEIDSFLEHAISDPDLLTRRLDNFTANDFFRCCALGYKANKYEGTEKAPREQYFRHADGRDGGLGDIDPDDPKAFAEWLHCREHHGAHPWEVCRGGNSTHVDLHVFDDEKGYFLHVAGTSTWRSIEAIKFFLAVREAGLPVVIHHAELLKDRLRGMEKVGGVPFGVRPAYCHSWFPGEEIEAFTNLSDEEPEKMAALCTWQPLIKYELQESVVNTHDSIHK